MIAARSPEKVVNKDLQGKFVHPHGDTGVGLYMIIAKLFYLTI